MSSTGAQLRGFRIAPGSCHGAASLLSSRKLVVACSGLNTSSIGPAPGSHWLACSRELAREVASNEPLSPR